MRAATRTIIIALLALAGCPPPQSPGVPPPPPPPPAPAPATPTPPPADTETTPPDDDAAQEAAIRKEQAERERKEKEFEDRLDKLASRPAAEGVNESIRKEDKHLRVWPKEKRIEVDGLICLKRGPYLELLACTRGGKTHESLLVFLCDPEKLHLGLILLGLKPSPQVKEFDDEKPLEGDKVAIEVEWAKDPAKDLPGFTGVATVRQRVEDLIYDQSRNGPMPRAGWVFTGSTTVDEYLPPDYTKAKKVYAAKATGTIAVTAHDPAATLDTALPGSQTTYYPWADRLPERFTPVIVHIRPWVAGDEKEEPFDPKKIVKPEGGGVPGGGPPPEGRGGK
jgi:hypothetical protein